MLDTSNSINQNLKKVVSDHHSHNYVLLHDYEHLHFQNM